MSAKLDSHAIALFNPDGMGMTTEEYLQTEPDSEFRREFINGYAYAMAGASVNHARITGNVFGEFRNRLKGKPCETFMSDIKVPLKFSIGEGYVYPDVLVDCSQTAGQSYFCDAPTLIVEVISKSTRKTDTTTKLIRYINLPSLQEYVLIEQDFVSVQVLCKDKHWQPDYYFLGDSITFASMGLTLSVADIYDRVDNEDMNEFRQAVLLSEK